MSRMFSVRDFPVNVRRQNSETETVYLGESPDLLTSWYWNIFSRINFQELNWRGLLRIITPSGKRAGSPPGLSLISRDSGILRDLLNQILWWVLDSRKYFKFNQYLLLHSNRFGRHQPILHWRMRLRVNQVRRVKLWVRPCGWRRVRDNLVKYTRSFAEKKLSIYFITGH